MTEEEKKSLVIAALGMALGATGGALVHPLASLKPRLGGYAASAVAGSVIGAPTALLVAKLMKLNTTQNPVTSTVKKVIKAPVQIAQQFFNSARYGREDVDLESINKKVGASLEALIRPLTDWKYLSVPVITTTLGRWWNPLDHFDNVDAAFKSVHRVRKNYIDRVLKSMQLDPKKTPSEWKARWADLADPSVGDVIMPNGKKYSTARKAIPTKWKSTGLAGYLGGALWALLENEESRKAWK